MRLRLIAVGHRPPAWVESGFRDYQRRLPREWHFQRVEIPAPRRRGEEGPRVLRAAAGAALLLLDERGQLLDTASWAAALAEWQRDGRELALVIGGADGHPPLVAERAWRRWSLSPLTLPHALVQVIVVEQLYRAWTLLAGHPYHRG